MRRVFALVIVVATGGCATLVEGTNQNVTVESEPAGATCLLSRQGARLGAIPSTPGSVRVDKSKNAIDIACTKAGFQAASTSHTPHFVGTTFGNIIAGGLIGIVVDAASGANYAYPDSVKMELAPLLPPPATVSSAPVAPYDRPQS